MPSLPSLRTASLLSPPCLVQPEASPGCCGCIDAGALLAMPSLPSRAVACLGCRLGSAVSRRVARVSRTDGCSQAREPGAPGPWHPLTWVLSSRRGWFPFSYTRVLDTDGNDRLHMR